MDRKIAYQECYRVVHELFNGLGERELLQPCPQCPAWSLRDVLAHHVHVFSERIKGWPEEFAVDVAAALTDPDPEVKLKAAQRRDNWIERGVESFRNQPFASVLTAWDQAMEQAGDNDWMMVADLAVHIGDIEEALGENRSRESGFLVAALSQYAMRLAQSLDGLGLETVRLIGSCPKFEGGDAQSPHEVSGPTYELLRALLGRRSRSEAEQALNWGTTPEAIRQVFAVYGWLEEDSGVVLSLS